MNRDGAFDQGGHRPITGNGPRTRTDVVDVYVFTRADPQPGAAREPGPANPAIWFLQLLRVGEPLGNTWQPVMGHVEAGETAADCALREMREELGLTFSNPALLGLWALEQVHPFYIAAIDTIVLSPRFAAEVAPGANQTSGWSPMLNDEHSRYRWVPADQIETHFMWPGQIASCREVLSQIVPERSLARDRLRIHPRD